MRRSMPIFYSALLLTGVNLLLRFVSTSFQVYISARIGAAGVGLLQLVLSVGALAITAGMAGVRTATMYLTAEELGKNRPQNVSRILSVCFFYSILCAGTVALILYRLAPVIAQYWIGNIHTYQAIRLFAFFLPVICLCGCMTGYFTAANRIGTLAAVEIAEQFCAMAVTMIVLTFWAGRDAAKACQAIVLGSGVGACLTLFVLALLRYRQNKDIGAHIAVHRRLLQTAVPLALSDDLKAGISTTENLMVPRRLALYAGAQTPLAAFGTVCGMVFPIMMFPAAILFALAELLIPELARCNAAGSKKRTQYLVKRSLRVCLFYGTFFCGIIFLLSDELCMHLYQSESAGAQLKMYSLMIPMLYCDAITDAMTKGLGQQKACVRYNILTSFLDVALLYILLPHYGMQGYFFSFFITHLINFLLSIRRLLKISGVKPNWKTPLFTLLSLFICIGLTSFLANPVVRILAYCSILTCLLFLLNVLRKADFFWLKSLVYKK